MQLTLSQFDMEMEAKSQEMAFTLLQKIAGLLAVIANLPSPAARARRVRRVGPAAASSRRARSALVDSYGRGAARPVTGREEARVCPHATRRGQRHRPSWSWRRATSPRTYDVVFLFLAAAAGKVEGAVAHLGWETTWRLVDRGRGARGRRAQGGG